VPKCCESRARLAAAAYRKGPELAKDKETGRVAAAPVAVGRPETRAREAPSKRGRAVAAAADPSRPVRRAP